ncbi:MAG: CdaR family protein [Thermodesulfobacteriota bacterium]
MSSFNPKNWQRIWSKEWVLRFVSLVLALILWYFVGGEDTVNKNIMVPVELINMPRDLVISNQYKKEIEVTVSGPRTQIMAIDKGQVRRQVDLAPATPGSLVVKNDKETQLSGMPRQVSVLRMQPASIILSLDKLVQKQFSIKPITTGRLAKDHLLRDLKMDPGSVTITGPQTVLSQVQYLTTKVIDIGGFKKSIQIQVPLELDAAIVDLIGETSVTADIVVEVERVQQTLTGLKVIALNGDVPQRVSPNKVAITLSLPKPLARKKINLVKHYEVEAVAEQKGDRKLKVQVKEKGEVLEGVKVIRIEPQFVNLVEPAPPPPAPKPDVEEKKEEGAGVTADPFQGK